MYIERFCKSPPWLLVVLLTAISPSIANAQAKFFGLGILPGATGSEAYGISADGSTVVGRMLLNATDTPARWTLETGWETLDILPGGNRGEALGVSGDGSVVVGDSKASTYTAAVRWTSTGVEDIGNLPSGISNAASAYATSLDGNVIVGFATTTNGREAFRWDDASGMVGLGHLGSDFSSHAFDISADGSVIVGRSSVAVSSGMSEAFRWTESTGMVGLGQLETGGFGSNAYGVSGDGNVIVGSARRPGITNLEGYRWTDVGGMVGLGDLPGGARRSEIFDANYDGTILVGYGSASEGVSATIWDESHGLRPIATFAKDDLGLDLGDWVLSSAYGISDDGTRITGLGRNPDGQGEAWMLVIPEPNTSLLLLAGFAVGSLRRRRMN